MPAASECQDDLVGQEHRSWGRRQVEALAGLIPVAALVLAGDLGGWLVESVGGPYSVGVVLGAVAGFIVSRAALRRVFGHEQT
jgi:hypothetical protein